MPFEIKSIYGIKDSQKTPSKGGDEAAQVGVAEEGEGKECLICLSEPRNTLIMPCGHLCVCSTCGNELQTKKYDCPICRGAIGSLIPFDIKKMSNKH